MEQISKELAKSLLEIKAVLLRPEEAFTWASGWLSPIYCDNRKILSHPKIRNFVLNAFVQKAKELYPDVEYIAGVATGAIAMGVLLADRLNKPFVYVRAKAKDHGTGSLIEGDLKKSAKVLVIEDLISTGMSSLAAVEALREAGADVQGMLAIFSYNFSLSEERFKEAGLKLDTLSNYDTLLEVACEENYILDAQKDVLSQWRWAPDKWNR